MSPARRLGRVINHGALVAAAILLPWTFVGSAEETDANDARDGVEKTGLVGLIGPWTTVNDDGPAVQIDGTTWREVEPTAARAAANLVFGEGSDAFVANATSAGSFPIALWRDTPNFTAGTLRVKFKLVGGATDQTAGIVFGLQPNGEYLFLRYNTRDGNLAVWGYANGERRRIADGMTRMPLPLGAWHELVVTVSGTKVTGYLNPAPALQNEVYVGAILTVEHTLDRPVTGRVGLWTKRDSVTRFRDFTVTTK